MEPMTQINLTAAEIRSGLDRVRYAEGLIQQLPLTHDGRNTWLLNYGISEEAKELRSRRGMGFDLTTRSATHFNPEVERLLGFLREILAYTHEDYVKRLAKDALSS